MITDYKIRRSHGHSCVRDRQVIPKIRALNFPISRDWLHCVEILILIMAVIEGKFNCSSALCTCAVVPPKRYAQPRDSARGR